MLFLVYLALCVIYEIMVAWLNVSFLVFKIYNVIHGNPDKLQNIVT